MYGGQISNDTGQMQSMIKNVTQIGDDQHNGQRVFNNNSTHTMQNAVDPTLFSAYNGQRQDSHQMFLHQVNQPHVLFVDNHTRAMRVVSDGGHSATQTIAGVINT